MSVPYGSTLDYRAVDVNGNVEAARALTAAVQPPTGVTATTLAAGAIAIRWSASPTAAVDPVTYTVLRSPAGAGTYVVVASGLGALSHSDAPAADGPYDYLVQAAVASSTSSAAGPATALSDRTPPTPSTLTASTGTATGTVELSWTAASDAGSGVAGYDVRYVQAQACPAASPGAYPSLIATGVTTSLAVGGLSSRTRYCFYVAARDAAGNLGDASAPKSARAK